MLPAASSKILRRRSSFSSKLRFIPEGEGPLGKVPRLNSVVSSLAIHAPVVVIGAADQQSELAFLVEAGAADFVERAGGCLPIALEKVERRLRHAQQTGSDAQQFNGGKNVVSGEAFGELLRHEMNNPLTGILGNAELLLAEVRRKNDGRLPSGASNASKQSPLSLCACARPSAA